MKTKRRKARKAERYPVIFRKDPKDGTVIAFFPETVFDGSVTFGHIMSYAHVGQSGEAHISYFRDCKPCRKSEYADLLKEVRWYLNQDPDEPRTVLRVMKRPYYGRRTMWPNRQF